MSDRTIDKLILVGCWLLGVGILALGFTIAWSVWPIMVLLAAWMFYEGLWTYLHNETLRRDSGR